MLTLHLAVGSNRSKRRVHPVDKEHGGDEQIGEQGVEKKGDAYGDENLDADNPRDAWSEPVDLLFHPPLYPASVPAMTIPLLSEASLKESPAPSPLPTASPPPTTDDVPNLDFV